MPPAQGIRAGRAFVELFALLFRSGLKTDDSNLPAAKLGSCAG